MPTTVTIVPWADPIADTIGAGMSPAPVPRAGACCQLADESRAASASDRVSTGPR